jgi:hypothetical protein
MGKSPGAITMELSICIIIFHFPAYSKLTFGLLFLLAIFMLSKLKRATPTKPVISRDN